MIVFNFHFKKLRKYDTYKNPMIWCNEQDRYKSLLIVGNFEVTPRPLRPESPLYLNALYNC